MKQMNTAQRRENKIHRTKTEQQNTPHEDGTIKYTVRRRKIKTNKYVKITLINDKEKQFGGVILGQN
jgi:hypothetical protein